MRALVTLGNCRQILERLTPNDFEAKVAYLLKGGLPGQSMSDGRGGGQGLPLPDKVDRALRRARKTYHAHARQVLTGLQAMERIEKSVLEKAPIPTPDPRCTNPNCKGADGEPMFVTDGSRGECGRCRTHKSRHGYQWPKKAEVPA